MPRNAAGLYTLPLPPVIPNTVIESDWANTTVDDLASAISDSLSRTGQGGMTAPFRLIDGTVGTPSLAFIAEPSSGLYRQASGVVAMTIQGSNKQTWNTNGTTVIGTTTLQGDVSITGILTAAGVVGPLTLTSLSVVGDLTVGGIATFNGAVNTVGKLTTAVATATPGAGFNIPHGVTPTTPINGDIWTLTTGLVARINGANRTMATIQGANAFTGTATFSSTVAFNGGTTIGDAAGDALTINSSTATIPNGLTFTGGTVTIPTLAATSITGVTSFTGAVTFTGGVTLGDAAGDALTIVSTTATIPAAGINFSGGFFGINRAPTAQLDVMGTPASTAQVCALVYNAQSNVTASMCAMGSAMVSHGPVPASSVMLSTGSGNTPMWIGNWQAGTGAISLMTNGAERARLSDVGWMALGKPGAPNAVLDILQTPAPASTGITSILLHNSQSVVTASLSVTGTAYSGPGSTITGNGSVVLATGQGNAPMWIGNFLAGTGYLGFMTNAAERMRIDTSGNVAVTGTSVAGGASFISVQNTQTGLTGAMNMVGSSFATGGVLPSSFLVSTGAGNTNMSVGQYLTGTGSLLFHTNGAERMRIAPEGNVGIGMAPVNLGAGLIACSISGSTQGMYEVYSGAVRIGTMSGLAARMITGSIANVPVELWSNSLLRMQIEAAGKVVVGTAAGLGQFTVHYQGPSTNGITVSEATDSAAASILVQRAGIAGASMIFRIVAGVAGTIDHLATNSTRYNTSCDARLKRNVRPVKDVGRIIDNIPVVSFDWKSDGIHVPVGLIAQDVHGVFPLAVHEGGSDAREDPWQMDNSTLVPLLIRELQCLRERVAALEDA